MHIFGLDKYRSVNTLVVRYCRGLPSQNPTTPMRNILNMGPSALNTVMSQEVNVGYAELNAVHMLTRKRVSSVVIDKTTSSRVSEVLDSRCTSDREDRFLRLKILRDRHHAAVDARSQLIEVHNKVVSANTVRRIHETNLTSSQKFCYRSRAPADHKMARF
ncbi:hypothetical protein C0J52_08672 [Blattella germanica]|nr:hypothetical protein C0J52_08672 [Blattella germanica]